MRNSHFTIALHILSFIALDTKNNDHFVNSERISQSVNSNPVFIRRILGLLNKSGLVVVQRGGVGAGWKLSRDADDIRLLDVYRAVEERDIFDMHHALPNQKCPVGRGIQPALNKVYSDVEDAMRNRLAQITVAGLLRETLAHSSSSGERE